MKQSWCKVFTQIPSTLFFHSLCTDLIAPFFKFLACDYKILKHSGFIVQIGAMSVAKFVEYLSMLM